MHISALIFVCAFLSTTFSVAVSETSINYCGARMCGNTNAHTFCQYPPGPSSQCVGYMSANLTNEEKSRVIARLNRRRNEAAAGRLRGLASAGNMLKLRWVEELAREAQRWADQCRPPTVPEERDSCRDLYSVPVGQCVASVIGEAPGLRVESMVDIWYMQNILYKGNATHYIPPNLDNSFYGDFGQTMWAQSYLVGCGRSRFMTEWRGRLRTVERLVCNIAPRGPPPERPLWAPSAPASLCPARSLPDTSLGALCDIQIDSIAIHEVDASMTLEEHFLLYTVLDIERNESLRYPGSLDELYLTRLAIATMDNIITTEEYYNSIQKRDVIEMIGVDNSKTNNNTSHIGGEVMVVDLKTLPSSDPILIASTKKKISLIGRPKSYNMAELNDLDFQTENYSPSEETTKKQKEFYAEYEFVEAVEDNSTVINGEKIITNINTVESASQEVISDATSESAIQAHEESSAIYEGLSSFTASNTDTRNLLYNNQEDGITDTHVAGLIMNESLAPEKDLNDLSDQETVQELQEALDIMERGISTEQIIETPGKVRRALKDEIEMPLKIPPEHTANRTLDKASIYNMVVQYMPHLKDYQNSLLLKSYSPAIGSSSSLVLVVSCCLYV